MRTWTPGIQLTGPRFRRKVRQNQIVKSTGAVAGAERDSEVSMRFKSSVSVTFLFLAVAVSSLALAVEPSVEGTFTANGEQVELTLLGLERLEQLVAALRVGKHVVFVPVNVVVEICILADIEGAIGALHEFRQIALDIACSREVSLILP